MRHSNLVAGILTACFTSLEVLEVPLALADVLASRAEYGGETSSAFSFSFPRSFAADPTSSEPLSFPLPDNNTPATGKSSAVQSTTVRATTAKASTAKTKITKSKYRSRYRAYKKRARRRYARYYAKSGAQGNMTKRNAANRALAAKSNPKSSSQARTAALRKPAQKTSKYRSKTRSYASRYRSSKSTRKYSRYNGKRYRTKSRYARRGRYRSTRSSQQQYASVSDAVRSVNAGLAQNWHETLKDMELMPGVRYKHYLISTGNKHSVHVLEVDRTKPDVGITLFKAQNLYNGLERLGDIANRTDSTTTGVLQGMINASFWKSASNLPLGPTIINGEVLEMGQYKEWSACFFDRQNRMYIERFTLSGMVKLKSITLDIEKVNRRTSKDGVVLYNHFAGKSVPTQPPLQMDMVEGDRQASPDELSDTKATKAEFNRIVQEQQRSAEYEKNLRKAVLLYSGQPAVNEEVACRVIEVDTGAVNVPQNGLVLSFGDNIEADDIPKPGDKIMVHFKTNLFSSVPFVQAVSGTPRLVNRGIARNEAEFEGARGERFMSQKLPRTAVGMDATGTILYFVATEGTSAENNTTGMTIQQLAEGMKQLGAYHAVSLDGGASSAMVVRGGGANENVGNQRKISVALGIIKQTPSDRFLQPRRKLITKPTSGTVPAKPEGKDTLQTPPAGGETPATPEKSNGTGNGLASEGSPNGKD